MTILKASLSGGGATAVALCQRCRGSTISQELLGTFCEDFVRTSGGWRCLCILTLQHAIGPHTDTNWRVTETAVVICPQGLTCKSLTLKDRGMSPAQLCVKMRPQNHGLHMVSVFRICIER